ncbi:MAG: hypothetical protein BZ138_08360, partial [Methanosphaera sp. rholeuAM270]
LCNLLVQKAAEYIKDTQIEVGFVSTNSICQGEQSPILWQILMEDYNIKLNFAHQSFKWGNEVKKKAGVFVIIIGFSLVERKNKHIFSYEKPDSLPIKRKVEHINQYLFDFKCPFIKRENNPRYPDVVKCQKGCKPNDGGNFIIKDDEIDEFLEKEPKAKKFIHPFIGSSEFINGKKRYCLWLKDAKPSEIKEMPLVQERINNIRELRSKSKDKRTCKLADYPMEFDTNKKPETDFIMIPETSSENRKYIPVGFMDKEIIPSSACFWIGSDDKYLFGMITSKMHMTWMKYIGGRLKGDYRYNSSLVYHTFPFPNTTEDNKNKVRKQVEEILKIREEIGDSYKDMYDSELMPSKLLKAHEKLDKLVDKCYRNKFFKNDEERMKLLFKLYGNYNK